MKPRFFTYHLHIKLEPIIYRSIFSNCGAKKYCGILFFTGLRIELDSGGCQELCLNVLAIIEALRPHGRVLH